MARPKSDIKERLQKAARQRFLLQGVDGASLREIARDAGTSIGMVYYYFPTKEDLFFGCIADIYGDLVAGMGEAFAPGASTEASVARLYARFAAMSAAEHEVARLVLREALVSSERRGRLVAMAAGGHVGLMLQRLLIGVQQGELTAEYHPMVMVIASFALGLLPQLLRRLVAEHLPPELALPTPEELAESMAAVLLRGLAARPPPPP